jgi:hypothetical protein
LTDGTMPKLILIVLFCRMATSAFGPRGETFEQLEKALAESKARADAVLVWQISNLQPTEQQGWAEWDRSHCRIWTRIKPRITARAWRNTIDDEIKGPTDRFAGPLYFTYAWVRSAEGAGGWFDLPPFHGTAEGDLGRGFGLGCTEQ